MALDDGSGKINWSIAETEFVWSEALSAGSAMGLCLSPIITIRQARGRGLRC
jgi:hypothetical protein